jgi:hypothetical protein
MNVRLWFSLVCGLSPLAITSGRAEIVANTFGPSDTYNQSQFAGIYWNVQSYTNDINVAQGVAVGFTVSNANYTLSSITVALGYSFGTNNLAISLLADNAGAPGALLETIISHPTDATTPYAVLSYQSSLHPVMAGGARYWLLAEPLDHNLTGRENNSFYNWSASFSGLGPLAGRSFNFTKETWNPWQLFDTLQPAFRIDGIVVPEPSAPSLALLAMLLCGWRRFGR